MARQSRLQRRGSRYFLRAKVPADLVPVIGKREITRALGTSVHAEALDRVRVATVEVDALFAAARRRRAPSATALTHLEIHQMVSKWLHQRERYPVEYFSAPRTGAEQRDVIATLNEDEAALSGREIDRMQSSLEATANEILAGRGRSAPAASCRVAGHQHPPT